MPWPQKNKSSSPEDTRSTAEGTNDATMSRNGAASSHRRVTPSRQLSTAEKPSLAKLRVQVIGAQGLAGKDRSGLSDPFVVLNLPGAPPPSGSSSKRDREFYKRRTPVQPKTLDPVWKEAEGTYEWNITSDWFLHNPEEGDTDTETTDSSLRASPERFIHRHINASNSTDAMALGGVETASPLVEKGDPIGARGDQLGNGLKPVTPRRPSNVRKLSAATTKILGAPVRMTAKGAVATTRAVRKRGPSRPMRLRRASKNATDGTVDLRQFQTQHSTVGSVEFVVWDKDKWSGNDYMGECSLPVASWVQEGSGADWESSQPFLLPLVSTRRNAKVSGDLIIRVGIVASSVREAYEIYTKLVVASTSAEGAGIRSIPADQSVGTTGPSEAFVDYDSNSDTESEDDSESEGQEELESDGDSTGGGSDGEEEDDGELASAEAELDGLQESEKGAADVPIITTSAGSDIDQQDAIAAMVEGGKPRRRYLLPKKLRRSPSAIDSVNAGDAIHSASPSQPRLRKMRVRVKRRRKRQESSNTDVAADTTQDQQAQQSRQKKRRAGKRKGDLAYKTELGMDIIGIVQMEVKGATDLPRWKNSLGTSFDMDAFVIVSFGERIFRTRVARHSLNPTWDEKLLFRVRQHESNFVTKMAIYDWDKLSANDYVGSVELKVSELIEAAPKADPTTGLYSALDDGTHHDMKTFRMPLNQNDRLEESKNIGKHHKPVLTIEAKFTPYECLRQRFWRQILTQYDTNDSGTLSNLELTSMLDSLGSTLSTKTIESFFSQFDKNEEEGDELTIDEAIIALEREIKKPWSEKRYVDKLWDSISADSRPITPGVNEMPREFINGPMDYTGPGAPTIEEPDLAMKKVTLPASVADEVPADAKEKTVKPVSPQMTKDMSSLSLTASSTSSGRAFSKRGNSTSSTDSTSRDQMGPAHSGEQDEQIERVIVLKSCPLCHMPRLSKKAEVDIVTHLAVCASQDWRRVDSMVVSNFVTASQAHRKWYTKVITKISQGQYSLGANSANIIVQDRMTGELLEEKMQVYVRLGIRLMYKGARSRMEGSRIKRMLKNMSVKQGVKFDSPASAREIPQFIAFHNLDLNEVREPLENFKTFNEFFYRKLKEDARPIDDPDDPTTLVSSADCRLMAFASITEATKVWIKGREFTVDRLLGDNHKGSKLDTYRQGGSLVIFRLAPQDYHRFHCPADGIVQSITMIQGQYYTVNPMAIRSAIDVYGENVRAVVEFDSGAFGRFYCVCIGAMMVGSINLSVKKGDHVKRGDEMGYYAFGGSTNVCIFEQGRVELDEDLLANSRNATETLVRVGLRIGKASSSNGNEDN